MSVEGEVDFTTYYTIVLTMFLYSLHAHYITNQHTDIDTFIHIS